MKIKIKYFANMRVVMGRSDEILDLTDGVTVTDLWKKVSDDALPENTLISVNMEYTDLSHGLSDGDEVAFFPPVTGG